MWKLWFKTSTEVIIQPNIHQDEGGIVYDQIKLIILNIWLGWNQLLPAKILIYPLTPQLSTTKDHPEWSLALLPCCFLICMIHYQTNFLCILYTVEHLIKLVNIKTFNNSKYLFSILHLPKTQSLTKSVCLKLIIGIISKHVLDLAVTRNHNLFK